MRALGWPTSQHHGCREVLHLITLLTLSPFEFRIASQNRINRKTDVVIRANLVVPRLLIQMDETQRTLDEFWNKHASHLKLCLQLRQFELDFRELHNFSKVFRDAEINPSKCLLRTRIKLIPNCCGIIITVVVEYAESE